jgi:hypothetical protein
MNSRHMGSILVDPTESSERIRGNCSRDNGSNPRNAGQPLTDRVRLMPGQDLSPHGDTPPQPVCPAASTYRRKDAKSFGQT